MYLTEENVFTRYKDAKEYTDRLVEPFPEYQRISRNEPYPGGDPNYPNVTDGTTASIIQKTPKRVVQQVPTGVVKCDYGEDWLCVIAEFIFLNKIIPYANEDYDVFEKSHLVIENGLGFGFCASYAPFLNHDGYFCPDMTIPYWGDIKVQKGKKSGRSAKFVFLRSWWQPEDIDALIESEKKIAADAKKRGEKYEATWDLQALEEIKDHATLKDQEGKTPVEEQRAVDQSAIEMVTGFQVGVGAIFFTFSPSAQKICRKKINKDPRGAMPIDWFYGDIDGTNPFGRSIIEVIGPLQNLIDSDMQAYQYNRALLLQPPVVKYGNIGKFTFAPNAVIDARDDPDAKIVPLTIDTTAIQRYPELYGLQKSQLLNLVASPDTSISADVGNPGFSKTPAGINTQKAAISIDDNAIRKRFEAWFESWGETAINLYFAERTGSETLQLDKDTADKLKELAKKGKFNLELLNDQDQVIINYDTDTPALKFQVDASTSKMADEQTQLAANQMLVDVIDGSPVLQAIVPPENLLAVWNNIVKVSGAENQENIAVDIDDYKEQQAQMADEQAAAQEAAGATDPTLTNPGDQQMLPPGSALPGDMPQLSDDELLLGNLKALGAPQEVVEAVFQDLQDGVPVDMVIQKLQGFMNARR